MSQHPVPISLLVDDPCPHVHLYFYHRRDVHGEAPVTHDGRPMVETIADDFLDRFCDVMDRWDIRGKFSIVPAPAALGDVVHGIEGYRPEATRAWIETARRRLGSRCDFCPECLTHLYAVDLPTGALLDENENDWSQHQTRDTLTPYLTRALQLLRDAGINATGVTSPWVFGADVEPEYVAAMAAAQRAVYDRRDSWYFLHMLNKQPEKRPWVALCDDDATIVSIPTNVGDSFWPTIDSPRTDAEYVSQVCDEMLTADGRSGAIVRVLEAGGWPTILSHWQSLYSNGLESGLAVLDELGRRVRETLSDRVQWSTCSEIMRLTVAAS
jgi:hypothetical protein